jgi:hypothetical protein
MLITNVCERLLFWTALLAPRHNWRRATEASLEPVRRSVDRDRFAMVEQPVEIAAAMIDRLVHHAEVIRLKGDGYRVRS